MRPRKHFGVRALSSRRCLGIGTSCWCCAICSQTRATSRHRGARYKRSPDSAQAAQNRNGNLQSTYPALGRCGLDGQCFAADSVPGKGRQWHDGRQPEKLCFLLPKHPLRVGFVHDRTATTFPTDLHLHPKSIVSLQTYWIKLLKIHQGYFYKGASVTKEAPACWPTTGKTGEPMCSTAVNGTAVVTCFRFRIENKSKIGASPLPEKKEAAKTHWGMTYGWGARNVLTRSKIQGVI